MCLLKSKKKVNEILIFAKLTLKHGYTRDGYLVRIELMSNAMACVIIAFSNKLLIFFFNT